MYPTLSELLTTVYSYCFPLDLTEDYSIELVKKRDALLAKIERAEKEGRSITFSIEEVIDSGIENLHSLNLPAPALDAIKKCIQRFIAYYAEHFVFYLPTFYFEDDTAGFILRYFLPAIETLLRTFQSELPANERLSSLPSDWYHTDQNNPKTPFSVVLSVIIETHYTTQGNAFREISLITGQQEDTVRSSLRRWLKGTYLPQTMFDCLDTIGMKANASDEEKKLLYIALILSKYYIAFYKTCDINASLEYIRTHGEHDYHLSLFPKESSTYIPFISLALAFHNRNMIKGDSEAIDKFKMFLSKNKEAVTELKLEYLLETVWGRYYSIVEKRYDIALEHYMKAFEEGKYRAGLFQRQICNEALHCASIIGKKREFKRVFRWAKFSDQVFHKKMGYAEMTGDVAFEFFKYNPENTIYQLHGDEFIISPLKKLVG